MSQSNQLYIHKNLGEFTEYTVSQKKQIQEKSAATVKGMNNLNEKFVK